ncbi:MAG: hypothetical protein B6244_02490 [Candidatus Cloacimonetes bacterium 4572_55]|nr:MAG: hypothetical protein B6244_02490 [Candidatus Cloacimonetes bacterium 4572_55]
MNFLTLILSGLLFHRRAHVAVLVGALISSAILVGALIVGDSVRHSLQHLAEVRLGRTEYALSAGDRFFRAELADDLALEIERDVAPIIRLRGIAIKGGGSRASRNPS